ncbi:head-tail connector protein [Anaeromassilibacillus senegalensis]|uniref:hypothetical protein n=1 Tax=Anaeromassilibacillus senegalensis TaxID=1673717 RepID=UPI000680FA2F|nr:hypothetical protein [Anaeromassilibacillus senegalensis]
MVDYPFYIDRYCGDNAIPFEEFSRLTARAQAQLDRYKRIYTVTAPDADSENMAVCAMADALYYYETAQSGELVTSSSIGSVSSSRQAPQIDISPKAQARELYRCACLYLDISRGCG